MIHAPTERWGTYSAGLRGGIHKSPPNASHYVPDPRPHLTVEMRGAGRRDTTHVYVSNRLLEIAGLGKSAGKGGKKGGGVV